MAPVSPRRAARATLRGDRRAGPSRCICSCAPRRLPRRAAPAALPTCARDLDGQLPSAIEAAKQQQPRPRCKLHRSRRTPARVSAAPPLNHLYRRLPHAGLVPTDKYHGRGTPLKGKGCPPADQKECDFRSAKHFVDGTSFKDK